MKKQIIYKDKEIPEIVYHGTTEEYLRMYSDEEGNVKADPFQPMCAIDGDVRTWALENARKYNGTPAAVIISTRMALSGIRDVLTSHVRFSRLPKDSYEVIKGSEVDFKSDGYYEKLQSLEKKVIEK